MPRLPCWKQLDHPRLGDVINQRVWIHTGGYKYCHRDMMMAEVAISKVGLFCMQIVHCVYIVPVHHCRILVFLIARDPCGAEL